MRNSKSVKIVFGVIAAFLLLGFFMSLIVESWAEKKIEAALNRGDGNYMVEIEAIDLSLWRAGLDMKKIQLTPKQKTSSAALTGEISSIEFRGINIWKAFKSQDIEIRKLVITGSNFTGNINFSEMDGQPKVSSRNIRIGNISVEKVSADIHSTESAQAYQVKDGNLDVDDLYIAKFDTLSAGALKEFDFYAGEIAVTFPDSFYTVTSNGLRYSAKSSVLTADRFTLHPNYPDYAFTDLHQYETDRFEVTASQISLEGFSAAAYLESGDLLGTYAEIGELNVDAFRDKREEFRHRDKPTFQEMIRNYSGRIVIDSVAILGGDIRYTEHDEEANEPGYIRFSEIGVTIYNVINDPAENDKNVFRLKCHALLMGKGRLQVSLESNLSDQRNTFFVAGTLSEMEVAQLNPMLDKNGYMHANTGVIDEMSFQFSADDTGANGKMSLLYHDLDVSVKNKETDKTTAIRERLKTFIANIKMMHSNPMPGEEVREGEIDYLRDPEKFLFNYCFKSVLSGIESTVTDKSLRENK
ncbi:MAG: hypothetical protein AAGU19_10235 [Prolixibacteraceae bacterium]